jgi:hypothetical protein
MLCAMSRRLLSAALVTSVVMIAPACKRGIVLPTEPVPKKAVVSVAEVAPDREPSAGQTRVLGNGWYANVEVDGAGNIHLAWTDADLGDVMYAVVSADRPRPTDAEIVEHEGAVGSYLRLALAPGDVPVLAYYHQDQRTLRIAHRPGDLSKMKEAGALISDDPIPEPQKPLPIPGVKPPPHPSTGMGDGWHGEEVAFGDNAGMAGSFTIDKGGRPHVAYYTKNERFRYARRPDNKPAFGMDVMGVFDKLDVDAKAGGSYTMSTGLHVLDDGTAVTTYAHWNYIDSQLKIAVLRPKTSAFEVVEGSPMARLVDGWHSEILPGKEGKLRIYSVATGEQQLYVGDLDPAAPAPLVGRRGLLERPGVAKVREAADGTVWVLTRGLGLPSLGETAGVWLVKLPKGDPVGATRWLLDEAISGDPWIDLALLPDGRPVAVWTSRAALAMKLYIGR